MENLSISLDKIHAFIFDFDGVLTNNLVIVNQNGSESVICSRSDGLAFDVLRKLQKPIYILSTEKNQVVAARAEKLKVQVLQGVDNKSDIVKQLADKQKFNLENILYVGNDINDLEVMKLVGTTFCPADAYSSIKEISQFILSSKGGEGVAHEIFDKLTQI